MAISNNLADLKIDFEIFGVNQHEAIFRLRLFKKGKDILAFYVNEKILNLLFKSKTMKKLKGAASFGIKIKTDKSLDKFTGKVLFPEKLKRANQIVSKLKHDF